jgi:hypothetical protein
MLQYLRPPPGLPADPTPRRISASASPRLADYAEDVRVLMILIPLALTIYAVVDCIQTDDAEVRNLPKFVWILLILFFWVVGPIAWLVAGRPRGHRHGRTQWPSTATPGFPEYERPRPVAPDDDPDFLSSLQQDNAEHEEMLSKWEEDLKRREEEMRKRPDKPDQDD